METTESRAAFEAWMKKEEGYPFARQFANLMWAAWQASRATLPQAGAVPLGYFVYHDEGGYEPCKTEQEAREAAEELLKGDRKEAEFDMEWPDCAESTCWGVILGKVVKCRDDGEACDYELIGPAKTPLAALHGEPNEAWDKIRAIAFHMKHYRDLYVEEAAFNEREGRHRMASYAHAKAGVVSDLMGLLELESQAAPSPASSPWLPIESAPSGELVLLLAESGRIDLDDWAHYAKYNMPKYTHWMPLPPPPASVEGG